MTPNFTPYQMKVSILIWDELLVTYERATKMLWHFTFEMKKAVLNSKIILQYNIKQLINFYPDINSGSMTSVLVTRTSFSTTLADCLLHKVTCLVISAYEQISFHFLSWWNLILSDIKVICIVFIMVINVNLSFDLRSTEILVWQEVNL